MPLSQEPTLTLSPNADAPSVSASGTWQVHALAQGDAMRTISAQLTPLRGKAGVAWDLSQIESLDHIGAQLFWNTWGKTRPQSLRLAPAQEEFFKRIEQAGNLGMTDSQFNLGMLHARGLGVPQDMEQSFKWFSLAARDGDVDAVKARDDIAKSLTADVVKKVKAEVDAWKPGTVNLAANFAPIGTWSPKFNPGEAIVTKDVISKVQKVLGKLGYDIGTPDGITGPKTAEAIKAFERGTGMTETGTINPRLLAVLGSQPV